MMVTTASAAVQCPPDFYPVANVQEALHEPDKHAWALFMAVSHPADLKAARGTPDKSKKLGDTGRVVWETWKLARTEVFKDDGSDPGGWDTPAGPSRDLADPPKSQIVTAGLSLKPKPLFDAGETGNETRQNCSTFKFIADNTLYNIEGQEELMRTFSARDEKLKFPMESMEVKASWRKFTDAEAKTDLAKQYYTFVDGNTVWGLATLHILTKELPNWFWTSFRNKNGPAPKYPKGDSAGMPDAVKNTVWANYELSGSQTNFIEPDGKTVILSDPIIEGGFEKSSCMSCHAHAGIRRLINGKRDEMPFAFGLDIDFEVLTPTGSPEPKQFLENIGTGADQSVFQQDFIFSLRRAKNKRQ
jgi:hypothetical protein